MGLDLFPARGGPASAPAAPDAKVPDGRSRLAEPGRGGDFDAAVDEAVTRRPRTVAGADSTRRDRMQPPGNECPRMANRPEEIEVAPPEAEVVEDEQGQQETTTSEAAGTTPGDPECLVASAPCGAGAPTVTGSPEGAALDMRTGDVPAPGGGPAAGDLVLPTRGAATPAQVAKPEVAAGAEPTPPTPGLPADDSEAAPKAPGAPDAAKNDPAGRGDAVRMIAAALRQAAGVVDESTTAATDADAGGAVIERDGHGGARSSPGSGASGLQLRLALESVLPFSGAPGRAEAAWRRAAEAAWEPALHRDAFDEGTSAPPSLSTGAPATGATQATRPTTAQARLSPAVDVEVGEQIVQGIRLQWRNGAGDARLRLQPGHLGTLDVSLHVAGGVVRAVVRAESAAVQDWIIRNRDDLRAALEAQGLRLEELDVVVDPDDRRHRQQGEAEPPTPRRGASAALETRTFEVHA